MNVLNQYITFLKEYKKLLERGVKDVLNSTVSSNFIWIDEIEHFIESGICESTLIDIFSSKFKKQPLIFSLQKPYKPNIQIPNRFLEIIEFDEAKNKFESINGDEEELVSFQNSTEGKIEIEKLKKFKKNKETYSKLYRAYNDIKNDSNLEIVLSLGFIQYSKSNNNGNLSKTNQHLFHFPLSLDIDSNNVVKISFSDLENPYADFFFLNNTPIEKEVLSNIIDRFEERITELGYEYIFENDFKDLIAKSIQKISSNSEFESSIYRPENDHFREDYFRVLFSPAINIKQRKPRFFEKLTDSIIKHNDENEIEAKLFNLLVRNPESSGNNSYTKPNYFKDELFEIHKSKAKNLNGDDDFSVFFPLPFNKEQKQIYENYLKNRLTVVTGPPGTGKSHTIVNILCSLLAQGKRVLVTAQTDKALESLLDKIPENFDDLIFTKIQLETNQNRFSLEKSIGNISKILTDNFYLNVETKIEELDNLKAEYVKLKSEIIRALEKEYTQIRINDSFENLRAYQIVEKFESKKSEEWNWIQDELSNEVIYNFEVIKDEILKYKQLIGTEIRYNNVINIDISTILKKLESFDFKNFLTIQEQYIKQLNYLGLNEYSKDKVLNIQLENITKIANEFSNSDIVLKNIKELENLQRQLNNQVLQENLTINKTFSDLSENGTKYLLDIETYLSFAENGKAGFFTKLTNSNFKQVSYLEQFTINGKKCNTKTEILQLKSAIENLIIINKNFTLLKQNGFSFSYDDNSNLYEKSLVLNEVLKKVETNKEVVSKIQLNADFINLSEYTQINLFDIDNLSRKAIVLKDDIDKLGKINGQLIENLQILKNIDSIIEQSSIKNEFSKFLPVENIREAQDFELLKSRFLEIGKQIEIEQTFLNLKKYLRDLLPNTFDSLENIPIHYISKENFEYASANRFIKENEFIDLQKCKEELSFINKKIFQVKCDILFDLAKSNFKNKFNSNEIDAFINLLEEYKYNLSQSVRKIRNQTQYQILTRKNSIDISKRLSCWVMKFNDVLNSVGSEPEIFDCVIVDEASHIQPQYNVKEAELFYNHKLGKQVYINFKIDLVVHNNGKMIAIECDGDPFHSLPEDVAYDIERQEFLERVGWKVYRVLYSAFKRSPQEEIQKIIDFIEKNTKKDHKTTIEKLIELKEEFEDEIEFENEEEISEYVLPKHKSYIDILEENSETSDSINQLNGTTTNHKHKSFIDMIEEDLEESNQNLFSYDSKILCYFNLFSDNTYKVQEHSEENCLFSLPIDERFKDGFLLQCYDNGHINKVYVNSILEKRMNYHYSNGKNPNANILYLKLIEEDAIIALKIKRGLETVFKAHKTENISNRELLHLQGYKVVYQTVENIEYKILPKNIYEDIRRLVFTSFTAEGKSVHNNYYENEWKIIKQFIPRLTE